MGLQSCLFSSSWCRPCRPRDLVAPEAVGVERHLWCVGRDSLSWSTSGGVCCRGGGRSGSGDVCERVASRRLQRILQCGASGARGPCSGRCLRLASLTIVKPDLFHRRALCLTSTLKRAREESRVVFIVLMYGWCFDRQVGDAICITEHNHLTPIPVGLYSTFAPVGEGLRTPLDLVFYAV